MTILTAFPPSNTIQPTTYLPTITEQLASVVAVQREQRFKHRQAEFFMLDPADRLGPKAVCYTAEAEATPGKIYHFDSKLEVILLVETYQQ